MHTHREVSGEEWMETEMVGWLYKHKKSVGGETGRGGGRSYQREDQPNTQVPGGGKAHGYMKTSRNSA